MDVKAHAQWSDPLVAGDHLSFAAEGRATHPDAPPASVERADSSVGAAHPTVGDVAQLFTHDGAQPHELARQHLQSLRLRRLVRRQIGESQAPLQPFWSERLQPLTRDLVPAAPQQIVTRDWSLLFSPGRVDTLIRRPWPGALPTSLNARGRAPHAFSPRRASPPPFGPCPAHMLSSRNPDPDPQNTSQSRRRRSAAAGTAATLAASMNTCFLRSARRHKRR